MTAAVRWVRHVGLKRSEAWPGKNRGKAQGNEVQSLVRTPWSPAAPAALPTVNVWKFGKVWMWTGEQTPLWPRQIKTCTLSTVMGTRKTFKDEPHLPLHSTTLLRLQCQHNTTVRQQETGRSHGVFICLCKNQFYINIGDVRPLYQ